MMKKKITNSRIVLATHYYIYSASQALRDFLRQNGCLRLFYVAHPLMIKDVKNKDKSFVEISVGNKVIKRFSAKKRFTNIVVSSLFEFCLLIKWIFRTTQPYDLYIGVDNLNALQGLILRKLGKVKKVVYYTIDYFPTRFENKFLNWLYHKIDKICVKNADETWNVSAEMVAAREKFNKMDRRVYNRQHEVPIGVWYNRARRKKLGKIDRKKLIFVGHLLPYMGVDLIIKTLPRLEKRFKDVKLEIVGDGQERKRLVMLAKKLRVWNKIKFYGWVRDRRRLEEIMSDAAIGLATFNTRILDRRVRNADPAKIKDYMQMGMPVITTKAVLTAQAIVRAKAGIVINYNGNELFDAVVRLLGNQAILRRYRENALVYIKKFDYATIFKPNIRRVLN